MELFAITCTTCRARLKVRDTAAIGQILACPKCGSMVQVLAPEDWQPPDATATAAASSASDGGSSGELPGSGRWKDEVPSSSGRRPAGELAGAAAASAGPGATTPESPGRTSAAWRDPVAEPTLAGSGGPAFAHWTLTKWIMFAGLPTMAVCAVLGVWIWSSNSPRAEPELVAAAARNESPQPAPTAESASTGPASTEPAPYVLDRRWVPSAAQGLLSLSLSDLNEQPAAQAVLRHLGTIWRQAAGPLYGQFDLAPEQIRRLTWITTDAGQAPAENWLQAGVVVIDLNSTGDEDRPALDESGTLDWKLAGAAVHPPSSDDWPHPFAVVDGRTIVTGPEAALRELANRTEPKLDNAEFARLLEALDFRRPLVGALDLAALRKARAMPEWLPLIDVWHVAKDDWRAVRDLPGAAGLEASLGPSPNGDSLGIELRLACDSETTAEKVQASLDRLLESMQQTLAGEVDGLTKKLLAGQIKTADAGRLKLLLSAGDRALKARESGTAGPLAWARTPWHGDLPNLAVAALASVPELESNRLAAARSIDEENHRQLLAGLSGYEKAEGALPFGAAEASLLPPETRLSWIATLLPYYDRLDWHGELNFARSWNDAANVGVTRRPLDQVINPALGLSQTKAGFPVTHYVGLAGIGADAGLLELRDPRAGAFGFRRQIAPADIADGASDTIALMGVQRRLGAWGAGGDATVRPLTQKPYINGPDGFGSGQPDGMFVGMADGSVRFLSQDIDPAVLEALATIHGGEKSPAAAPRDPLIVRSAPDDEMPLDAPAPRNPGADADVPRPRPSARPEIDVEARLNDPIPAIRFEDTPLADVVQFLSELSTAPIMLDPEALAEVGIEANKKVSVQLTDTTVGEVLAAVLKEQGLAYVIVDGQVVATNPERREQHLATVRLDVGDLISGEPSARQLAGLVARFVEPASWEASGGPGGIEISGGKLVVRQTHSVAQQVSVFLDKLRLARGKAVVGEASARSRSLQTRYDSAKAVLEASITVNFRRPARLAEIAEHLRSIVKAQFLFDGLALSAAGVSPDTLAEWTVAGEPLAESLKSLLDPLHLGYRIIDAKTILITTAEAAGERLEIEFYRVGQLTSDDPTGEALIERIKTALAPRSWDDAGGPGSIELVPSDCLIVLQTQPRQIELERLLALWSDKAKN
ncbi:MAG TPA: DUF1559 domain-containing protein [Pirellulales bacterium]|nr:DUF1559 domain-containing protein [Pirellulales bacterium]